MPAKTCQVLEMAHLPQVANGMAWEAIVEEWHGRLTKRAIAEAVRLARETLVTHAGELVLEPVGV